MKNYRVRLIASAAATATLACPQLSLGETANGSLERAGAIGTPDGSHYSVESLKGSLGDDLLLVGPVESVDLAQQSLSMLGQTVVFAQRYIRTPSRNDSDGTLRTTGVSLFSFRPS